MHRNLPAADAIDLMIRAAQALRDGMALYLSGDIPWQGPNARPGRLLGRAHRFLAIWTELAVITRAPVFHVFCTYLPGGRFRLEFEAVGRVQAGEETEAVADYLKQLEAQDCQRTRSGRRPLTLALFQSFRDRGPGPARELRPGHDTPEPPQCGLFATEFSILIMGPPRGARPGQ